jgi:phosphopantothenoylcysteine decarboxylase/phosphopantothenate--cysteine ligase
MREPDAIVESLRAALRAGALGTANATAPMPAARAGGTLAGRTVLVSAAGTREAIDPVRFIGNRSSGKMGYALAAEAARRGARVQLVSGPTHLEPPVGVSETVRVETADEMLAALAARIAAADVLLMAAAVADYRPRAAATGKIKRGSGPVRLDLEPTPDLLATLGTHKGERLFVGFALETGDPEAEARAKLRRKGLDLIVANRVGPGTGFDSDTNAVWIYDAEGLVLETPRLEKSRVAVAILDVVETRLGRAEVQSGGR